MLDFVLLLIAVILFALAGIGAVISARINLIGLGLMFWALAALIHAWPR